MLLVVADNDPIYHDLINFIPVTFDLEILFKHPETLKGVLFTGGPDINPELYGHSNLWSGTSIRRDLLDLAVFKEAMKHKIPMFGICRGFQFINVMAGGTLIQHVDNHTSTHPTISFEGKVFMTSSTHHQLVNPPKSAYILAHSWEKRSSRYIYDGLAVPDIEIESAYFPNINAFGTQWHPEFDLESRNLEHDEDLESIYFFRRHLSLTITGAIKGKVTDYKVKTVKDCRKIYIGNGRRNFSLTQNYFGVGDEF